MQFSTNGAIAPAELGSQQLRPFMREKQGRQYRLPTESDYAAVCRAQAQVKSILERWEKSGKKEACPIPDEPTPTGGGSGAGRAFSVQRYGMLQWGDLYTARQKIALSEFSSQVAKSPSHLAELLSLNLSHITERNNSLCRWYPDAYMETVGTVFGRQALPIVWDFAESVPLGTSSGGWDHSLGFIVKVIQAGSRSHLLPASVNLSDAASQPLPNQSAGVWFTDPPYYDAVPYADLSDFFLVWLKRALANNHSLRDPFDPLNPLSPKEAEAVQDETKLHLGRQKDRQWFEESMANAFSESRRVLKNEGIGSVVFAHKTTEGWEALLSGMIRGGWTITGSWPIATEMAARLRARDSAALATSIHLICRPREENAPVGEWSSVLRELPNRVGDWMQRLHKEGVRGADLVFACIGPALEIYSRYSAVETPEGRGVALPEYLERVWEVVAREALEQILGTAEAQARNGAAGALEEDARLTALFLWTLQSTDDSEPTVGEDEERDGIDIDDEAPRQRVAGFSMPFDVARRFAQPLGIHLEEWESRNNPDTEGSSPTEVHRRTGEGTIRRRRSRQHGRRNRGQFSRVGPTPPLPRRSAHGARPGPGEEDREPPALTSSQK